MAGGSAGQGDEEHVDSRPRKGRPRDPSLTGRVLESARQVLAENGSNLTLDAIAHRAGSGKASLYRRWPNMTALLADVITTLRPRDGLPHTGNARGDFAELLKPLIAPIAPVDRTTAAAVQMAVREPELRALVDVVFLAPLRRQVGAVVDRHAPPDLAASKRAMIVTTVEGLWCRRYLLDPATAAPTELNVILDEVLLPLLGPPINRARPSRTR
jgi:AcrR family transcriptional regulator